MKLADPQPVALALDGYTQLPRGLLGNAVTWLEMRAPLPHLGRVPRPDLALAPLHGVALGRYLAIYRTLGQRWLWQGRLQMDRAELARLLDDSDVAAFALVHQGRDAGLLELDFRQDGEAELAYFGLVEPMVGTGAGAWLMQQAVDVAVQRRVQRLWVHTCSFDHPGALGFYRHCGFAPYASGFEVMRDPRLSGLLPLDAAPHVPLLE